MQLMHSKKSDDIEEEVQFRVFDDHNHHRHRDFIRKHCFFS